MQVDATNRLLGASGLDAGQQQVTSQLLGQTAPTQPETTSRLLGGTDPAALNPTNTEATSRLLSGTGPAPFNPTNPEATSRLLSGTGPAPLNPTNTEATSRLLSGTGPAPLNPTNTEATSRLFAGTGPAPLNPNPANSEATSRLLGPAGMNPGYSKQEAMPGALGATQLATRQDATARLLNNAPRLKQDGQFEIHFVGELEVGVKFPSVALNEGLFVDYQVLAGEGWIPIAKHSEGYVGQTQTAYADGEGVFVFNHPLDVFYITTTLADWPKLHLQVLRLDPAGRVDTVSYGAINLPMSPGHAELNCRTWAPLGGSAMAEARAVHAGDRAELVVARQEILDAKLPEERMQLLTQTSGTVEISIDTIFRNAEEQGILIPGRRRSSQVASIFPETWR